MPFPVTQRMSVPAFQRDIIDHYWPNLDQAIAGNNALKTIPYAYFLPFDYAEIGGFLSDPRRVERFLVPLEREIRAKLKSGMTLPATAAAAKPYTTPSKFASPGVSSANAYLKAHKLLSNALRKFESESGFNHEKIQNGKFFDDAKTGTLFSTAATANASGLVKRITPQVKEGEKFREPKPAELAKVALPKGVPTVVGDLDALAFNPLLRHGYQFKDVGAGAYHGEYTHRLQWYAITAAAAVHDIFLFNTPLDIYKSMGYLSAKAPDTDGGGVIPKGSAQQLWIWQALFDTAENADRAVALKTLACQGGLSVYTCPESMNKALISSEFLERNAYDANNCDNLWCLRILLATRWKKRFDQSEGLGGLGGVDKVSTRMMNDKTAAVISSASMQKEVKSYKEVTVPKTVFTTPANQQPGVMPIKIKTVVNEVKRVETGTAMQTKEMRTLQDAGYALVWYLRNDEVR
ncbi:LirA/MavJ family T4SS effector [Variovorax sp. WS11]|uniref:LirA/MavJ family T4SS effector n=1 Tax=Variovorax sp. WS11 TaxID=1105204 RepID=UPI0011B2944F|nr:LirA/MavJ family T4SS effector [Variovorax sp. WS11]NDZ13600.1 hypothetical protein [Variovorax sp. WS11]